ncbi:MAG: V-type ATP synthase subunit A, partial [Nanoarchaeota archaeon]
ALPDSERLVLEVTKLLREDFLQQNAYHDVDAFCSIKKQYLMLKLILEFYSLAQQSLESGTSIDAIPGMKIKDDIARMKEHPNDTFEKHYTDLLNKMKAEFKKINVSGDTNE